MTSSTDRASVRSFHRTVGLAIRALDERFLGGDRPMGEARVLWEIGDGADVRDLRRRLDLDAGYLRRLVASLEHAGLVRSHPDADDRRVRRVEPTPAGRAEQHRLDQRSDALATSLLDALEESGRSRMVAAMRDVERLLVQARTSIRATPASDPDVRLCFRRYVAELDHRFPNGFDVARSNRMDLADVTPPEGLVLLARLAQDPVGCGALTFHGRVGTLKRMWVSPRVRGTGLGRRLLSALEAAARAHGSTALELETSRHLPEAVALYRSAGFRDVPPFSPEAYADHWMRKALD